MLAILVANADNYIFALFFMDTIACANKGYLL